MEKHTLPPDTRADSQAVIEHITTGKPLDPETCCRIRARAKKITDELRQQYGETNMAVDLIREIRDEE
jgi:hypothetical protein